MYLYYHKIHFFQDLLFLILSNQEILDIINIKNKTLSENSLFEFENNVIVLFMEKFCKSSYIYKDEQTLLVSIC